jgi:hypothetical protein
MARSFFKARGVLVVLVILALMSGCKLFGGGGGSSSASSATVEGVATPSSVSVVSATNAN